MTGASATRCIANLGLIGALVLMAGGVGIANAQAPGMLTAVDFNFAGQANLGAPFQVESGRIAEVKSPSAAIRNYAHLMVTSHVPVVEH
jgi:putative membrane protein